MTATLPVTTAPARPAAARGFVPALPARSAHLLSGLPIAAVSFSLLSTGVALVALPTLPLVVAGCAAAQAGLGRALLGAWDD